MKRADATPDKSFYRRIKQPAPFSPELLRQHLQRVDGKRVNKIGSSVSQYLRTNLPIAIESKVGLGGYRTNPYVLMTAASTMKLNDMASFASFLFNSKMYAGLEKFGRS